MDATQRLEFAQELYKSNPEYSDQIGFLGICGKQYPLKVGTYTIGRDPKKCNIVLDSNSISKRHAMINVNKHAITLMDLGSVNKTKLSDKTLVQYVQNTVKNGDIIQFGEVFGVFQLLEDDDDDLPATQMIEVPQTPVHSQYQLISKLNTHTTIPESPDVSDKDDSFIAESQSKPKDVFKTPHNRFLKESGKTIAIKPIGTNTIDNVYWASSKKSDSFTSEHNISNNHDVCHPQNIHELDTQLPYDFVNESPGSLYSNSKQVDQDIHEMETQLPEVCEIYDQQNSSKKHNFATDNKENETNIFNKETQLLNDPNILSIESLNSDDKLTSTSNEKSKDNISNDITLFDENDCFLEENYESQSLIAPDDLIDIEKPQIPEGPVIHEEESVENNKNGSTDCDDDIFIAMTQNIIQNDYVTDCEDEPEIISETNIKQNAKTVNNNIINKTTCEDDSNNIIQPNGKSGIVNLEEMPTQVLTVHPINVQDNLNEPIPFEDMLTQVIEEDKNDVRHIADLETQVLETVTEKKVAFEEALTQQIYSEELVKFKMPRPSPFKIKSKELGDVEKQVAKLVQNNTPKDDDDDIYYAATQELYKDLCSQRESSPEIVIQPLLKLNKTKTLSLKPSSENKITKQVKKKLSKTDTEKKVNSFLSNLTDSQIMEVVGVEKNNILPKKTYDADVYFEEKKELNANSRVMTVSGPLDKIANHSSILLKDIKSELKKNSKLQNNSDIHSPILLKKERRNSNDIRIYLKKKDKSEAIPARMSTRVRKTTSKIQDCDEDSLNLCKSIHQSRYDGVKTKKGAITDNISQSERDLRNKNESAYKKSKRSTENKKSENILNKEGDKLKDETTTNIESEHKPRRSRRTKEKNEQKADKNEDQKTETKYEGRSRSRTKKSIDTKSGNKKSEDINKNSEIVNKKSEDINKNSEIVNKKFEEINNKSKSLSNEKSKTEIKPTDKRKRTRSKEKEQSPKEKRRSKRQRTSKKSEELTSTSTGHEQSAVYNVSSESGIDSPKRLKKSANFENLDANRSSTVRVSSFRPTSARRVRTHYILFTAFPCEEVKAKLEKLGAVIVTEVRKCTVVLTMGLKRTIKLLCAVGLGKPIVGPQWVQACTDNNIIVDPWLYLIKDEETEARFQFNLQSSLVSKRNFLKGYNVSCTPVVKPAAEDLKSIVECNGGKWKAQGPLWICVSSKADQSLWPALKKNGAIIVSSEFILGGVLRQQLDLTKNRLD